MKKKVPRPNQQKRMVEIPLSESQQERSVGVVKMGASPKARTSGPKSRCGLRLGRSSGEIHGRHPAGLRMFFPNV
jgi:hypothetical protein